MMTPNEGLPVNEVDVEDAQPKESAKTASNHKKKIAAVALLAHKKKIAAVALLACVGALVGLLVAKPWQSDEATATATAAADEVVLAAPWPHERTTLHGYGECRASESTHATYAFQCWILPRGGRPAWTRPLPGTYGELILIFFLSSTYLFLISFVCNFTTILPPPGIQWSAQL
jgi:hypothetical protein